MKRICQTIGMAVELSCRLSKMPMLNSMHVDSLLPAGLASSRGYSSSHYWVCVSSDVRISGRVDRLVPVYSCIENIQRKTDRYRSFREKELFLTGNLQLLRRNSFHFPVQKMPSVAFWALDCDCMVDTMHSMTMTVKMWLKMHSYHLWICSMVPLVQSELYSVWRSVDSVCHSCNRRPEKYLRKWNFEVTIHWFSIRSQRAMCNIPVWSRCIVRMTDMSSYWSSRMELLYFDCKTNNLLWPESVCVF